MNAIAAIAVALEEANKSSFKRYAEQIVINAKALAEGLIMEGFRLVSGGTDNHLILVDLRPKGILGKEAAEVLEQAGLVTNMNLITFDPTPPVNPSGIRLGTPSVTTRGLKEKEMVKVAFWINEAVSNHEDSKVLNRIRKEVLRICDKYPFEKLD